ncbi:MAG: tetratricopeptide repeat protein, partial [Saprospiraceae bacterium]|nr:tetratricopeptide repeat protein [Saprospiraceae bacterium]
MNKPLYLLIDDSVRLFRERQLKKAVNTALIALEFGKNEGLDEAGLAKVHLMLSLIYNTNGLYQNDPSFFKKAFYHLEVAKEINESNPENEATTGSKLIEGQYHLNIKEYGKCLTDFEAAFHLAKSLDLKIFALAGLGNLGIAKNDVNFALAQAQKMEELLEGVSRSNAPQLWAEKFQIYSQAYILQQDYSKSLEMSQELLRLSKSIGDAEKEVIALRNIAVVCGVKSNYKIGMQYFLEALTKCEAIGFKEMLVQIQINIGTLYAHLYNYDEAIKRYESVLGQFSDVLDPKTNTVVFNNMGNIYLTSDNPQTALDYFKKANKLASDHQFADLQAYSYAQLSRTKIALEDLEEAKQDALSAQSFYEKTGAVSGRQINLLNLSKIAYSDANYELALEHALQSANLSKQIKDDASEIKAYKLLALIFKQMGDFAMAYEYQERYSSIQEEFSKVQRTRHNLDMEIRHAIREQQKEIELLMKENEYQSQLLLQGEQIARQNEELLRVNEDLRQFAYIASHDLKEPLRMISSFSQVIHKIAKPHLAEKDHEYFNYVFEGVNRMNNLLDGLL